MKRKRLGLLAICLIALLIIAETMFKKPIIEKNLMEYIESGELKKGKFDDGLPSSFGALEIQPMEESYTLNDEAYRFQLINNSDVKYGYGTYFQFQSGEAWCDVPLKEDHVKLAIMLELDEGAKELIEVKRSDFADLCPGRYRMAVPLYIVDAKLQEEDPPIEPDYVLSYVFTV